MNKAELIEYVANEAELSKAEAERALNAIIKGTKKSLKKGDKVVLVGFGTFKISHRAARMGRNPQTGAAIKIKASKMPVFKAGDTFKEEVNG